MDNLKNKMYFCFCFRDYFKNKKQKCFLFVFVFPRCLGEQVGRIRRAISSHRLGGKIGKKKRER
jgi:hypothetical protein